MEQNVAMSRLDRSERNLMAGFDEFKEEPRELTTIHRPDLSIIAEIRPPGDRLATVFDPRVQAQEYAGAGCMAVAACTDTILHDGDVFYCKRARTLMPLPMIRWDYIVTEYQVVEARSFEADAVTVPVELLDTGRIQQVVRRCREIGLMPVMMVSNADDARTALSLGSKYVFICDLRWSDETEPDIDRVRAIREDLPEAAIIIVHAPGLRKSFLQELADAGIDAALGSPEADDPWEAGLRIRELVDLPNGREFLTSEEGDDNEQDSQRPFP